MNSKTKIVVLHQKEVIYTAIFILLGILFIFLMLFMFLPGRSDKSHDTPSDAVYNPGVYTTSVQIGEKTMDIEVYVDANNINSIRMVNLDESIATLYPLMEPAFDNLVTQICETQSLENITYNSDSKYTSLLLLDAIEASLQKATISPEETDLITE